MPQELFPAVGKLKIRKVLGLFTRFSTTTPINESTVIGYLRAADICCGTAMRCLIRLQV